MAPPRLSLNRWAVQPLAKCRGRRAKKSTVGCAEDCAASEEPRFGASESLTIPSPFVGTQNESTGDV